MNQNNPHNPNHSVPQSSVQQSPPNKKIEFTRARILFLILLFILILFFSGNSIVQTVLALLGIGTFEPIFNPILKYSETLIINPIERFWHFLFKNHLISFGFWLKDHRRIVSESISLVAIVILLAMTTLRPFVITTSGNINDFFCLKTPLPWFTCNSGYGVSILPNGVRIGLINDNTYGSFDQSTFKQAETKVENLIFKENRQACSSQHTTLIATTMLSRTIEDPLSGATLGLQNLQGYYLWQHEFNAQHPLNRLCLAIANLGTPDNANNDSQLVKNCSNCYSMPQIIYQIAQLAHFDTHVRGIVGFPYSQQVIEALDEIKKNYPSLSDIPIISPSASSDNLSNSKNFYRIDAPDQIQGEAMAQYFCHHLSLPSSHYSIAILTDNNDYYSGDLPLDFKDSISRDCPNQVTIANNGQFISYRNGYSPSIQAAIHTALSSSDHPNYIFFPGYDEDLDTVEAEIHRELPNSSNTVTILGGDGLNNVNTTTHYAYNRIYAASFDQPPPLLSKPPQSSDRIVQEIKSQEFAKSYTAGNTLEWIPKDMLLAIDAAHAFTQTVQGLDQINFSQDDFNTKLETVTFPDGMSGQIAFYGNRTTYNHISNRDQETIYITCYDTSHILNMMLSYNANIDNGSVSEIISPPSNIQYDKNSC